MTNQPRKPQHKLKVGQGDKLKGNLLRMLAMNAYARVVEVSDRGTKTAIDEFDRNRMRVGLGLQQVVQQKGGVQKGAGGTRVDQGHDINGKKARNENVK